jgi:hypothetical protein
MATGTTAAGNVLGRAPANHRAMPVGTWADTEGCEEAEGDGDGDGDGVGVGEGDGDGTRAAYPHDVAIVG